MNNLIERLRRGCDCSPVACEMDTSSEMAADEIERLSSEYRAAFDAGWKGGYLAGRNRDGNVRREEAYATVSGRQT